MIRRLLLILALSPLVLLLVLALLMGTPVGARLVAWVADTAVPGLELTYEGGKVNTGLSLSQVRFEMSGILVEVDEIRTAWRLRCLLQRQVCADELDAQGVRVAIDTDLIGADSEPSPEPEEPAPPPQPDADGYTGMGLPLTILGRHLDLRDIDVRVNDMTYKAERLLASAEVGNTLIAVQQLALDGADINIPLGDDEAADEPTTTDAPSEPGPDPDPAPPSADSDDPLADWAMANLPEVDLPFAIDVRQAQATDARVQVGWMDHRVEHLSFLGSWRHTELSLPRLTVRHNWANLDGSVWMDFRDGYGLETELEGEVRKLYWLPELDGHRVRVTAHNRLTDLRFTLHSQGLLSGELDGRIQLGLPTLPFELSLDADALQWPLNDAPEYQAQDVVLRAQGDLDHQEATLSGKARALDYPKGAVNLALTHLPGHLSVTQAELDGEMGWASVTGELEYGERLAWQAKVEAKALDLSSLHPELSLQLDGQAVSGGHYDADSWAIDIDDADLNGELWGYPLKVLGNLDLNSQWRGAADNLQLAINQTELTLDGGILDEQWQVDGRLEAAALSRWLPELTGRASADLTVRGTPGAPRITLALDARQPGYGDYRTSTLDLDLDYYPRQNHRFELAMESGNLDLAGTALGPIQAQGRGDLGRQDLDIELTGELGARLALGGNYYQDKGRWRGALLSGAITTPYGQWETDLPALLEFSQPDSALVLGAHCWQGAGVDLCLQGPALIGPKGALALTLDAKVREALQPILPQRLRPRSRITGQAHVSWMPGQLPLLQAQFQDRDGSLVLRRGGGLPNSRIEWQAIDLNVNLGPEGLLLDLQTQIDDARQIGLDLKLGPEAPYAMEGRLVSSELDLSPYLAWIPALADAQGLLSGDITLGGTLQAPQLNGELALKEGQIKAVANPTELENLELIMTFEGDQVVVDGEVLMGQGRADLNGTLGWIGGLNGTLDLDGERLSILYPPMVVLEASPDLQFVFSPELLKIRGDIKVPSGSFTLTSLPEGAVAVSGDVVYVDSQTETESPLSTHLDLNVELAVLDNFTVQALGLTGKVGGNLTLRQQPGQPLQAFGDMALKDGVFRAFGQRLTISRGQANFNGPPALPNLEVEAVRIIESEDVTAGVRVTGTPASPQMTLFSTPAMEQQEILSYITRGQGLNSSDGGSALFASAALGLGVNTTQGVFTTIGEGLGFKNVTLDTESDGEDTQVTISGYLGERLFLKYGVGVFGESINELTVRYYLLQALWLEAVSAMAETTEQSLDIYYSFDID
ncbi:translocation/assembly module TamB domain-containing protein [Ferrimonas balearica]|uniref:autotransporter assembly complex protein TamB n=1 Tax=Ferrimonas balearica TaxID=44012 RepID=UPI001C99DED2|nr:translocation/assembly module TamB domain-containing protein [Ferrimonas balearica]MBY5991121.1 translocation/assembly module TamB domain-containing protein [Ferrimonas balearica]